MTRNPAARTDHLLPMSQQALSLAETWEQLPGERRMAAGLLRWMAAIGWLGSATKVAFEVPWRGRRIDLVTLNGKGGLTAFEFKLSGTGRAFEQALYNSSATHRSYVVLGGVPSLQYQELAQVQGLGVVVVNGSIRLLARSQQRDPEISVAGSLRRRMLARLVADV